MAVVLAANGTDNFSRTTSLPTIDAITFMLWFKHGGGGTVSDSMFSFGENSGTSNDQYELTTNSATASSLNKFADAVENAFLTTGGWDNGAWHHFCITQSGTGAGAFIAYHNVAADSDAGDTAITTNAAMRIGKGVRNATASLGGSYAAVKVWGRVLTPAEIADEFRFYMPVHTGSIDCVVPLLENTGLDYSGNGRNWTASGSFTLTDGPRIDWAPRRRTFFFAPAGGDTNVTPAVATGTGTAPAGIFTLAQIPVFASGASSALSTWIKSVLSAASIGAVSAHEGTFTLAQVAVAAGAGTAPPGIFALVQTPVVAAPAGTAPATFVLSQIPTGVAPGVASALAFIDRAIVSAAGIGAGAAFPGTYVLAQIPPAAAPAGTAPPGVFVLAQIPGVAAPSAVASALFALSQVPAAAIAAASALGAESFISTILEPAVAAAAGSGQPGTFLLAQIPSAASPTGTALALFLLAQVPGAGIGGATASAFYALSQIPGVATGAVVAIDPTVFQPIVVIPNAAIGGGTASVAWALAQTPTRADLAALASVLYALGQVPTRAAASGLAQTLYTLLQTPGRAQGAVTALGASASIATVVVPAAAVLGAEASSDFVLALTGVAAALGTAVAPVYALVQVPASAAGAGTAPVTFLLRVGPGFAEALASALGASAAIDLPGVPTHATQVRIELFTLPPVLRLRDAPDAFDVAPGAPAGKVIP